MTHFVASHGLYAVFLLMAIDAVFPAASELVMVVGGALAAGVFAGEHVSFLGAKLGTGVPAYLGIALAGTVGYLLGSLVGWAIGRFGGRPLLERRGRWFHLSGDKLDRAERWFDRWGPVGVLVGRVTPVVRSFVSIPAGVFEMPLGIYTLLTLVGSAVWAFALAGVGWGLGHSYEKFHHDFRFVDYAAAAVILAVVAYALFRWRKSSTIERGADPAR